MSDEIIAPTGDTLTLGQFRALTRDLPDDTVFLVGTPARVEATGVLCLCATPDLVVEQSEDGVPGTLIVGFDLDEFVEARRLAIQPAARAA